MPRSSRTDRRPRVVIILGFAGALIALLNLCFLWFSASQLEKVVSTQTTSSDRKKQRWIDAFNRYKAQSLRPPLTTDGDKFIVFNGLLAGQGEGNKISGLLSAHLLGLEFNRTVCVSDEYESFLDNFEPLDADAIHKCPAVIAALPRQCMENQVRLINYEPPPDECDLRTKLESGPDILYFHGNTYPRWRSVPENFFFRFYKPRPELQAALPYKDPPEVVVHLREPDGKSDPRAGLDDLSLKALGNMLPRNTYLVTNRVDWYDKFENEYGWAHPGWNTVVHIAAKLSWGSRGRQYREPVAFESADERQQARQLWADWLTVLTAKRVYHTHSDFSISAIHWMNIESKELHGIDPTTGKILLGEESWRSDGEGIPLALRHVDGDKQSKLSNCKRMKPLPKKEVLVRDRDWEE